MKKWEHVVFNTDNENSNAYIITQMTQMNERQ